MNEHANDSRRPTKTETTCQLLESKLKELIPSLQSEIRRSDRMEQIIPAKDRRRVCRELQQAGFKLTSLNLSISMFLLAVILALMPSFVLAILSSNWTFLFLVPIMAIPVHWLTRQFAIYPPMSCETVYLTACYVTRFTREDYRAGLWSQEEVANKVRVVLAEAACASPDEIRGDMTMEELFGP